VSPALLFASSTSCSKLGRGKMRCMAGPRPPRRVPLLFFSRASRDPRCGWYLICLWLNVQVAPAQPPPPKAQEKKIAQHKNFRLYSTTRNSDGTLWQRSGDRFSFPVGAKKNFMLGKRSVQNFENINSVRDETRTRWPV